MKILGIWDGHDAGAALIEGDKILFAINEERLTRRKLEVAFPQRSILSCLEYTGTPAADVSHIAVSTSDVAKTLSRFFPNMKEEYYLIRRRKKFPGKLALKRKLKYKLTEYPSLSLSRTLSRFTLTRSLKKLGFQDFRLHLVDHHLSHAAGAAFCSGFPDSLVLTIDGVGDGLSGSIWQFECGVLKHVASLPASHSMGIFFEHVTNLMNMRELEDEGKVMALANYAYPIDDSENPMLNLMHVEGLRFRFRHSSLATLRKLKHILWQVPSEQFAYMAQRTLELKTVELARNAIRETGLSNLCLAGGVFSNIKLNRLLRLLPDVKKCFVFPHMGDGGLAVGAALATNNKLNSISHVPLPHVYLGPDYHDSEIEKALHGSGLPYRKCDNIAEKVAELISSGEIVMWFQNRMEYGPRALGCRSILARPDCEAIRHTLNLRLKKRVWYQPFCPSMLPDDASEIFEDYNGTPDRFMTMAYMVREIKRNHVRGVINIDGSCRPHIAGEENPLFRKLLLEVKARTGYGIVLNTSFNLHGDPLVCSPENAIMTMLNTESKFIAMGNFLVELE